MWPPFRLGNSEERNAKPLISPFTLTCPRLHQILTASNGMRIITHFRGESMRCKLAWNDVAADLGIDGPLDNPNSIIPGCLIPRETKCNGVYICVAWCVDRSKPGVYNHTFAGGASLVWRPWPAQSARTGT